MPESADWPALRRAKYRGLLRIAARDRARPFDEGLSELSELADGVLRRALALASGSREPPALFALGKLGGRELNFSSDVDLLFVCDAPPDDRGHAARESAAAVVRELKRRLDEPTDEGFAYRVDLDLRPEGPAGALVRGVEGTLGYYELRGAEWERQMLLRLRHLAGAPQAARAFERGIEPFVYRRAIDPGVIDAVRAMKARIETERREHGRDIDGNLKEGPGGIRDVEFTVQALQLFYAGRRAELRTGNVLAAIEGLARAELLPASSATVLADGYRWLRRAEHALQLAEEQQTAQLPRDAGRAHRARAADGLCGRRGRRRDAPLRGGSRAHAVAGARAVRGARAREPRAMSTLAARFDEVLAGTPLDARRSPASARFAERRGGDAAAGRLSAPALRGLARLVATQPEIASFLANRPAWLEQVAALAPGALEERGARLAADGAQIASADLESALDFLRLRRREETALAACAQLGGLAPFEAVSEYLSLVAETTTRARARSRAPPRARRGRGRRCVRGDRNGQDRRARVHLYSDLDLIFLYGGDAEIDRASRLGQRLIAYLTTMTGAGVAYEVDTRLRPSGQQGMLVASFEGYERYQTRDAATWEHLAMLRARPIAGAARAGGRAAARRARARAPASEAALARARRPAPARDRRARARRRRRLRVQDRRGRADGRRLRRGRWAARARRAVVPGSSERRGDARRGGWRGVRRGAARRLSLAAPRGGVRALGGGTLGGAAAGRARSGRGAGPARAGSRGAARRRWRPRARGSAPPTIAWWREGRSRRSSGVKRRQVPAASSAAAVATMERAEAPVQLVACPVCHTQYDVSHAAQPRSSPAAAARRSRTARRARWMP